MASIEKRGKNYRITFRLNGEKYSRTLKTNKADRVELAKRQIEKNLELIALGFIEIPADCDVFEFVLTGKSPKNMNKEGAADNKKQVNKKLSR